MKTDDTLVAVPLADLERLIARAGRRWLCIQSAASYADLSEKTIRRLLASGVLMAHRPVRGKILIDRLELDSLIAGATSSPRRGRGLRIGTRRACEQRADLKRNEETQVSPSPAGGLRDGDKDYETDEHD